MTSIERLEKEIRFYSKGSVANGEIINKTALDKKLSIIDEQGNVVGYAKLNIPLPIPVTAIQNDIAPRTKCGGCHGRKEGKYK